MHLIVPMINVISMIVTIRIILYYNIILQYLLDRNRTKPYDIGIRQTANQRFSDEEIEVNTNQKAKLERYFRNADRFMWGIIPSDKRAVFETLRTVLTDLSKDTALVPDYRKSTYAMVIENLLSGIGIETILTEIVVGQVKQQFVNRRATLDFLRTHWMSGTLPRWQTLQSLRVPRTIKQKLVDAVQPKDTPTRRQQTSDILDAFVEVNTQYNYVHGWTVFAGLWFEEIEPLLK